MSVTDENVSSLESDLQDYLLKLPVSSLLLLGCNLYGLTCRVDLNTALQLVVVAFLHTGCRVKMKNQADKNTLVLYNLLTHTG